MSLWGGGGSLITWPSSAGCIPARLELGKIALAASKTNPFTGTQQSQDWQASYALGSCLMPAMDAADGTTMQFFLDELNGIINVFQFSAAMCNDVRYYYWLVSTGVQGGPGKYFRLKNPMNKVSITEGGIYNLTFEFREAI